MIKDLFQDKKSDCEDSNLAAATGNPVGQPNVSRQLDEHEDTSPAPAKHDPGLGPPAPGIRRRRQKDTKDPVTGRKKPGTASLEQLIQSPEFLEDLERVAQLMDAEKTKGLAVGEIADRWIGNQKYNRFLNPERFAEQLKAHTGCDRSGKQIQNYMKAYREHRFHEESGRRFPNLSVGHLAQIAASRCSSDAERLELAERANRKKVSVRQIRHLAQRLHAEMHQASRTYDVAPIEAKVHQMDALDLLRSQADRSIHCLIADWQWSDSEWGQHGEFPEVHCPDDPVDHLCRCLELAATKLADDGYIFVHFSTVGFEDPRIKANCDRVGLKHAGKIAWQKSCGAIMNGQSPTAIGYEEVLAICRKDYIPKSACGYVSSVTPKWAAPTNAHSGRQHEAVHRFQKPVELMEYLISIATKRGLVVDLFAGSGSAGVAAARKGCEYVGSELVPEYVEIANRRIALAAGDVQETIEAINFFLDGASPEQAEVISQALKRTGLRLVRQAREVAA